MSRPTSTTKFVQASMEKLYPLALADRSWDNVGLLLEPAFPREITGRPKVLLTIDLTAAVAQEAIDDPDVEIIVTYRISFVLLSDRG